MVRTAATARTWHLSVVSFSALTFRSHDVYDQVVPRRLKSAPVVGRNLQNPG